MRVLFLDIETYPTKTYTWSLIRPIIPIEMVLEPGGVLCWGAKWWDEKEIMWCGLNVLGTEEVIYGIHSLLDQANIVVHFNGDSFDIPWLNMEFVKLDLKPPSPYKNLDLYKLDKRAFKSPSHKLAFMGKVLKVGEKLKHEGVELWKKCLAGDPGAWVTMERYNKQDVRLLEQLYKKLQPWLLYRSHRY